MANQFPKEIEQLKVAMEKVEKGYYVIPRYNANVTVRLSYAKRERTYCYELYHQLRSLGIQEHDFTIHAEIDKRGHKGYDGINPDFVIHTPGSDGGLMVIEVKINPAEKGMSDDIRKLNDMVGTHNYQYGVFVLVGKSIDWIQKWRKDVLLNSKDYVCNRIYVLTQLWKQNGKNETAVVEVSTLQDLINEVE